MINRLFAAIAAICLVTVLVGDCAAFGGRMAARRQARQGCASQSSVTMTYSGCAACGQPSAMPVQGYYLQCGPNGCQMVPIQMPVPAPAK